MMRNKDYPLYEQEEYETLSQMVWEKAQKCGDKIAFQYRRGKNIFSVTYREYLDDVLATSKYLSEHCNGRSHIAILGENSYPWLVTFMATVMSGNVAVPLDKELGIAEISELLTHSDSQTCVYSEAYSDIAERLSGDCSVTFLPMRAVTEAQKSGNADDAVPKELCDAGKHDVAAIFYTSGTSGKPKGVMLSQENMMEDINFGAKNLSSDGNALSILPFYHTFGLLTGLFALFYYECTIFICSSLKNVKRDMLAASPKMIMVVPMFIESFYKTIQQTVLQQGKAQKMHMAIAISNLLLRISVDIRKYLFRSVLAGFGSKLEYIVCGGAPLQAKHIRAFREIGIEILNAYGMTECSPGVAISRNYYHRDGSVGQVIKGCEVRIQGGEIQVQGKNVMLGYYRDEEATAEAFDDGWFKTGDLGYMDGDGFLYVTGRKKNLIVLSNGENVSPEELESLLLGYDQVKEVVVYEENGIITAEVFPDLEVNFEDVQKQLQDTVDACNRKLPAYKRIQRMKIRQTEFSKTTTQKIKR